MTDTEIVNWLEDNGEELYTVSINNIPYFVVGWINHKDILIHTYGANLRDAVIIAKNQGVE